MMVLVALFIVAVPAAVAQTPVADQYSTSDDGGAGTADDGSAAAPFGDSAAAPVQVRGITAKQADALPFTGGQISLIALIGLALLAVGAAGLASSRRRTPTPTT